MGLKRRKLILKAIFTAASYLVPAFQGPFPLFQHKALVFVRSLDVALTNFQSLNDFPTVWLLDVIKTQ